MKGKELEKRYDELSKLNMIFNGDSFIGTKTFNKDFNIHYTEILTSSEKEWEEIIFKLKTIHFKRKRKETIKIFDRQLQKEALAHYKIMMDYAKDMLKENKPYPLSKSSEYMFEAIKTNWYGQYCSYCMEYLFPHITEEILSTYFTCILCPLNTNGTSCCDELWDKIGISKSWSEFLLNTSYVYNYILKHGVDK